MIPVVLFLESLNGNVCKVEEQENSQCNPCAAEGLSPVWVTLLSEQAVEDVICPHLSPFHYSYAEAEMSLVTLPFPYGNHTDARRKTTDPSHGQIN